MKFEKRKLKRKTETLFELSGNPKSKEEGGGGKARDYGCQMKVKGGEGENLREVKSYAREKRKGSR